MVRLPRFVIPDQTQHVIQRGNERQANFRDEQDYRFYLEKLRQADEIREATNKAWILGNEHNNNGLKSKLTGRSDPADTAVTGSPNCIKYRGV